MSTRVLSSRSVDVSTLLKRCRCCCGSGAAEVRVVGRREAVGMAIYEQQRRHGISIKVSENVRRDFYIHFIFDEGFSLEEGNE